VIGGIGALAATLLTSGSVQVTGMALVVAVLVAGPPLVVAGLWVAPWLVRLDLAVMRRTLFDSPQVRVRRRLWELSDTRSRMVDAAEAERRRIERDLHDGAQQRLLSLTLTLARARAKFDRDPEQARELVEEAQREARAVMAELREVARGLHPKVLTDHGLDAALPVAAGRCPVPVRLEVHLDERPSPRAEGVAYYVVCEALTNVAKHAQASAVTVRAERSSAPPGRPGSASPSSTTAAEAPTRSPAPGCTDCPTGSRRSTVNCSSTVRPVRARSSPLTFRGGRNRARDHR